MKHAVFAFACCVYSMVFTVWLYSTEVEPRLDRIDEAIGLPAFQEDQ